MRLAGALGTAFGFFVGILAHEIATHRLAVSLGDKTPALYRRTSVAPAAHADPLGSYVVPSIFIVMKLVVGMFHLPPIGWGKRHAVNPRNARDAKRNAILVSLAGPAVTAIFAVVFGVVARGATGVTAAFFEAAAVVAAGLTVLELLPLPGRDGGRILQQFLSPRAAYKMEELVEYEVLFLIGAYLVLSSVFGTLFQLGCQTLTGLVPCW